MGIGKHFFVLASFFPFAAYGALNLPSYEGELTSQVELREDIRDRDSVPFDNYLKLQLKDLKEDVDLYFYGKLWKDVGYGTDWNIDLYQLYAKFNFSKGSTLYLGRQFISEGFETYTADAVKFTYLSSSGIRSTIYLGKPRYFEPNTYSGDDFLAGFKLDYDGYFLAFEHLRDDGKVKKSSFVFGFYRPFISEAFYYSRLELDAAHGELTDFKLGLDYYSRKWKLNFEGEFYNPSYTYGGSQKENVIFSLFSPLGRELRFTSSFDYTLNENWQIFGRYTFTDLQRKGKDNGHLFKIGFLNDRWFLNGLRYGGALIYQNSWLGILRGVEVNFDKWISKRFSVVGTADVGRYDKITYGKQWVNAFYLKGIYRATDFSRLELGLDYRRNEDFERDLRVILRYNCLFWGKGIKINEDKR